MNKISIDRIFKEPDKKDWDETKTLQFWILIWENKTKLNDFHFDGFVFPEMIPGSFGNPQIADPNFDSTHPALIDAKFIDCLFLGAADFSHRHFNTSYFK